MFVITGATGKVGGGVAEALLEAGLPVRAVVRSPDKGEALRARGCEIAVAPDAADGVALARAFEGAEGVFLMNPPDFDPEPGFPLVHREAAAAAEAIAKTQPGRIVFLSSIGAQASAFNLLNRSAIFEQMLRATGVPVALLRPAWFMENAAWDVPGAREGRIESYLQPLDRGIDMVSTEDVGRVAADLLREAWSGVRIVELAGPRKVSPNDIAAGFAAVLGRPVQAVAVPRGSWAARFRAEGMRHPEARICMLQGFNEGWIAFQGDGAERRTGAIVLEAVIRDLAAV